MKSRALMKKQYVNYFYFSATHSYFVLHELGNDLAIMIILVTIIITWKD